MDLHFLKNGLLILSVLSLLQGCQFGNFSTEDREETAGVKVIRKPLAADLTPTQLQLKAPTTAKWKECSGPFVAVLRSAKNVAAGLGEDISLSFHSKRNARFFTDATCFDQVAVGTLPAQQTSFEFFILSSSEGEDQIEVSGPGLRSASATTNVLRLAEGLSLTGPTQIVKGNCSEAYRASLKDIEGNPLVTKSAIQVYFTGATVYADSNCFQATTGSRTINPGVSSVDFYLGPASGGTINITASAYGMEDARIQNIVVIDALAINPSSNIPSLLASTCSPVSFAVSAQSLGSTITVTRSLVIGLTGVQYYSNAACNGSAITTTTIDAGTNSSAPLYVRPGSAATVALNAFLPVLNQISVVRNISVVNNLALAFSTTPASLTAGVCSPVDLSVTALSGGVQTSVPTQVAVSLTGNGSSAFYSDAACTNQVASVNILSNTSRIAGIFVRVGSNASSVSLTASATNLASSTVSRSVVNQLGLLLSRGLVSLTREVCVSATFTLQALSAGSPTLLSSSLAVSVAQSPAGVNLYSNAGCSSVLSSIVIPSGAQSVNFYMKVAADISQASLTFAATGNAFIATTNFARPVVNEVRINAPSSVLRHSCSASSVSISSRSGGNPQAVNDNLSVSFSGDTSFLFADSDCSIPFSGVMTISSGNNQSGSFFVKANATHGSSLVLSTNAIPFAINAVSVSVTQDPLGLDPIFGQGGVRLRDLGGVSEVSGMIYHASSGRYVFVGKSRSGASDQLVLGRFSNSGQFDSFFGGVIGVPSSTESWGRGLVESGGNVFVAGGVKESSATHHDFFIGKYNSGGFLSEHRKFDFGAMDEEEAVGLFISGSNVYVVGNRIVSGVSQIAVVRYDLNLNNSTVLVNYAEAGRNLFPAAVVPFSGGFAVATKVVNGSSSSFGVYKFDLNGTLDSSFSQNAIANFGIDAEPTAMVAEASRLMVVGNTANGIAGVRFSLSGAPDASFGTQGKILLNANTSDRAFGLVRETSGTYVVLGGNGTQAVVERINASGQAVLRRTHVFGGGNTDEGRNIVLNSDGTLTILGTSRNGGGNSTIAASRILP